MVKDDLTGALVDDVIFFFFFTVVVQFQFHFDVFFFFFSKEKIENISTLMAANERLLVQDLVRGIINSAVDKCVLFRDVFLIYIHSSPATSWTERERFLIHPVQACLMGRHTHSWV